MLRLFAPESVDSIVGDFQKKIDRLAKVTAKHRVHSSEKRQAASDLTAQAAAHDGEAVRAERIQRKINTLLED